MEVALEGMQCLGGNGYINGQLPEILSPVLYTVSIFLIRLSNGSHRSRL